MQIDEDETCRFALIFNLLLFQREVGAESVIEGQ
jgi:hypothetical protein